MGENDFKPGMLYYKAKDEEEYHKVEVAVTPLTARPIQEGEECPKLNATVIERGIWQPRPFTCSGTVKISKRDFKRLHKRWFKKARMPRKMKKAAKHMIAFNDEPTNCFHKVGDTYSIDICIGTKNGYPVTKWIKKVSNMLVKSLRDFHKRQDNEMVITKEQRERLAAMMSQHTEQSEIHKSIK